MLQRVGVNMGLKSRPCRDVVARTSRCGAKYLRYVGSVTLQRGVATSRCLLKIFTLTS